MEVTIDALDLTVLRGGADEVGTWATDHGFRLPPDAPEVLEFYAQRSPIFLAAAFDGEAAAGPRPERRRRDAGPHHDPDRQPVGPAAHPRPRQDRGRGRRGRRLPADRPAPAMLPAPTGFNGMTLEHAPPASDGCSRTCGPTAAWNGCPSEAWLTKVALDAEAPQFGYDLASMRPANAPSRVAAGLDLPGATDPTVMARDALVRGRVVHLGSASAAASC